MTFAISIPLDQDGKHIGEVNISLAGGDTLRFPIASVRNGNGPCLYINAGTHGDEYEGQIALRNILQTLEPSEIAGQLVAVPTLNVAAAEANRRRSPLDELDLNRSFPGDPDGSATQRIASFIKDNIVPLADAVVDLHAAGTANEVIPHAMVHRRECLVSDDQFEKIKQAALAFGMPAIFVFDEPDPAGLLDTLVEKSGKPFLCVELGHGGQTTPATVRRAERGIRNMLIHFGLMQGQIDAEPVPLGDIAFDGFVVAEHEGLFEFIVEMGAEVQKGQLLGHYHSFASANGVLTPLLAPKDGCLAARRRYSQVNVGDFLAGIATPYNG
jgi:N2-acetyl-L-2,4-diaminobutanoate deacetylase